MKWTDIDRIAEELADKFPELDPKTIRRFLNQNR